MSTQDDHGIESITLLPINYFSLECDCYYLPSNEKVAQKKYMLPSTAELNCEDSFAELFMGWNEEGLSLAIKVKQKLQESCYPNPEEGDSVELFLDTRDIKSAGFNHRFCHHFVFLPQSVDGVHAAEITHFRTEDIHELCDSHDLKVKVTEKKSSYEMEIWVPAKCLHGYDASQCDRLGFSYRVNRCGRDPQHFSLHSAEYQVVQNPSQWSRMRLIR